MTLLPRDFQRKTSVRQPLIYTAPVVEYVPSEQALLDNPQPMPQRSLPLIPLAFATPTFVEVPTPPSSTMPLIPLSGLVEGLSSLKPPEPRLAPQNQSKQTDWHKLSQSLQQQPFTSLRSMAYESKAVIRVDEPIAKRTTQTLGREEGLQTLYVNRPMVLADDL
jgi:hypothetical protein